MFTLAWYTTGCDVSSVTRIARAVVMDEESQRPLEALIAATNPDWRRMRGRSRSRSAYPRHLRDCP
ncbi:MAG: hypothetical protein C0183_14020 [Roseiflexus castenholzii]|nr:MAG: hypothetical protein C0183_14020 [Roseiflexus castenholzii]